MKLRRWLVGALLFVALFTLFVKFYRFVPGGERLVNKIRGRTTSEDRLQEYGATARARLLPYFEKAGVTYPPARFLLVGLKEERQLQLYSANTTGDLRYIRSYPILGASGELGPKLREGDLQVPEGVYQIESLNPNSAFHLSLRVNYPNDYDRAQAKREGRDQLGGDIMIHGGSGSVGCLAMGDEVAEELFCLAAEKWPQTIKILLCPRDLREKPAPEITSPTWTKEIYRNLKNELQKLPSNN
ncbi:MAG TPA: L,D-transpeptidase family protein [Abditibacteriaceae bacterium]|jgi:hypothetical protein